MLKSLTMASSTSKKTMERTSNSSAQTKTAGKVELRPVYLSPSKPAMTEEEVEAFILSCGGRPTTPEESRMFWKAIKDPYS
jgi:hypothetical protein